LVRAQSALRRTACSRQPGEETQTWAVLLSDILLKPRSLYFDIHSIVTVIRVYVAYFTALCGFLRGRHLASLSILCGPLC
jgi:hypothetical protein